MREKQQLSAEEIARMVQGYQAMSEINLELSREAETVEEEVYKIY